MSFRTRRRVEFRDTDAAGIVHFSAFFPWMEAAEHEMLRSLEIPVLPDHGDESAVTWPRVSARCDYKAAARFEDWMEIEVRLGRIGDSSVSYEITFLREEPSGPTLIATGQLVAVCCRLLPGGSLEKSSIPADIRTRLQSLAG